MESTVGTERNGYRDNTGWPFGKSRAGCQKSENEYPANLPCRVDRYVEWWRKRCICKRRYSDRIGRKSFCNIYKSARVHRAGKELKSTYLVCIFWSWSGIYLLRCRCQPDYRSKCKRTDRCGWKWNCTVDVLTQHDTGKLCRIFYKLSKCNI